MIERKREGPFRSRTIRGLSRNKVYNARFLFLILVLAVLVYGGFSTVYTLEVKNRKNGKILFRERVNPGERFVFRYTHSVEKMPVEGTFTLEADGRLRMVETRFPSHGPGLPSSAERDRSEEGWFVHRGGDRYEALAFLFSSLNRPILRFRQQEISLAQRDEEGGTLTFSVQKDSLAIHLLKKLFHVG